MFSFQLNMQILYDELTKVYKEVTLFAHKDELCLNNVRFYRSGENTVSNYVYMINPSAAGTPLPRLSGMHVIICGKTQPAHISEDCCALIVKDCSDFKELFTLVQNIFEKYDVWNQSLQDAMDQSHPLDAMLKASIPVFQNPIFVHDTNFHIIACSHRAPGMLEWSREPRTNQYIVPLGLINDFKTDTAYLHTLTTSGPDLYPAEQRGYPILYVNLWNHDHYEGRICIDELETPILPGQYPAIQHLADLILSSIRDRNLFQMNMINKVEHFFRDYLDGKFQDHTQIMKILTYLDWKRNDRYLCLRLETSQNNLHNFSSAATLGHIETQIPQCYPFTYQDGITVIVNLSKMHLQISDVLSSLAILLREGLLKMGVSSEIHDFLQFRLAHYQAQMALNLGSDSNSTSWCYRFDDYILEFLLKQGTGILPPEMLCSHKLLLLKDYDEKNHTELYHTLNTFLTLERNVLQTAKTLYIHRSTLFYRLERIQKIADVNLADAKERLILRFSFYILEGTER